MVTGNNSASLPVPWVCQHRQNQFEIVMQLWTALHCTCCIVQSFPGLTANLEGMCQSQCKLWAPCAVENYILFKMQPSQVCMTGIGEGSAAQCLCQLWQKCDKCAVRVLRLYLFAVWWFHDSRSVYEFLLEPDGCKATKLMPATYKCQTLKTLHVNIHRVRSQQHCRAFSQRQAVGLI